MSAAKKKCRQYHINYLKFGFIECPEDKKLPLCLFCLKTFSNDSMKPSKLEEHLKKQHSGNVGKPIDFFNNAKQNYLKQTISIYSSQGSSQSNDRLQTDGLQASYKISLLVAQKAKPHNIAEELIVPALSEVLTSVIHYNNHKAVLNAIPLSNSTVQRRIDEMADDVERQLCEELKKHKFSLQLDESTLPNNDSLLLAYVRYVAQDSMKQELLFADTMDTDTKGESILKVVKKYFEKNDLTLKNILSCATDGAPAMSGKYKGFCGLLKKEYPHIFTIHCVVHRQHLVAKKLSDDLNSTLSVVIKVVNLIKSKQHALNSRLFKELCKSNDEEFETLVMHTEVRWLSKGNCLIRFWNLFDSVLQFLNENGHEDLANTLSENKNSIAYLTDIFTKFNIVNKELQGDNVTLISTKSVLKALFAKFKLFNSRIGRKNFTDFPCLQSLENVVRDDELLIFCNHLEKICDDMSERFKDLFEMRVEDWVIDPFIDLQDVEDEIQNELVVLQNDEELKNKFKKSYQDFWLQEKLHEKYPFLWDKVQHYFVAFPTSYLVERGFSAVSLLLTKQRQKLKINERGDLRLFLTKMTPCIKKLADDHQAQGSH